MPIFGEKKSKILGVDLGSSAIKIVELERYKQSFRLVTYGIAERDQAITRFDTAQNQQKIAGLLKELTLKARATATRSVVAISALNVFNAVITLPKMPDKEITSAIRWEAKKMVPLPIDRVTLSWQIIPARNASEPADKLNIILTAAPKDVVENYLQIFKMCDLTLIGAETEITAMRRSLITDDEPILLMDIGATNTNMALFSKTIPVITRNIDVGGETIALNIANALNVSEERAKQFRDDIGLPTGAQFLHPVAKAMAFVIDNMVIREIRRIITSYHHDYQDTVKKIIILGGANKLKNFTAYISETLKIETEVADPWKKISYPTELKEELTELGAQMAVAAGLAMKQKN
ncbi:MAG: type IV pilus assembly protein PilM [Patescibacteria group bacterium]|jgi:type IV pilus assembly protein PilM